MTILATPDDSVHDQPDEPLTRQEAGRFAQLAESLRDLPATAEQRRTAREANAAWSILSRHLREDDGST
jgi:hypothetical protein